KKYIYDGIQKHDQQVGHYINTYVGYSQVHRQNSSSGGIATYFLEKLLEQGIVDHVVCVSRSGTEGEHYEYGVFNSVDKVRSSSKTRYYP
ncbi:coenzyme F420 hydrogenase, partial [Vibrio parahaemolyticus]|nr:coenzyme F420 hydrogenase [Vibrio parahaemolyticus]